MADRFIGRNKGQTLQNIVDDTSTNSTGLELRYTTAVGIDKVEILRFLEEVEAYILQTFDIEVA